MEPFDGAMTVRLLSGIVRAPGTGTLRVVQIGGTTKRLDFRQYGRFGSGHKRWERHFDTLEIRLRTDGACSTIQP